MSLGPFMFAGAATAAAFSLVYGGFKAARELAMWNWIARGRLTAGPNIGSAISILAVLGRMQETLGGIERFSRWLHEKAAPGLGEGDPGRAAWLAGKELGGLAAGAGIFWLLGDWALALTAAFCGFWLPDLIVRDRQLRRQDRIRRELPEVFDLLSLAVEGGMSLDAAFAQVSGKFKGNTLAEAVGQMQGEIRFGARRHQAWRDMAMRLGSSELREMMAALAQADALGVGLAQSIKGMAGQMRVRRRQQVEELAHKAPVKMLFPLVLCIFPAVFIILLGPVFLQLLAVTG